MAEANQWTDAQSINALPICLNGPGLEDFIFAPQRLKAQVANQPAPTLPRLFVHMVLVMGVIRNDRAGQNQFTSLVQIDNEILREFARGVRSMASLVFAHRDIIERDDFQREQF